MFVGKIRKFVGIKYFLHMKDLVLRTAVILLQVLENTRRVFLSNRRSKKKKKIHENFLS